MRPHNQDIINQLNPRLFWDTDPKKLDPEGSSRLIIERVFSLGSMDEIKLLIQHYGKEKLTEELTRLNYLDPKSLNFAAKLLDIPRSSFKAYKPKGSQTQYCSFCGNKISWP